MNQELEASLDEQVQEPDTPESIKERLKAERIQDALRKLPGWLLLKEKMGIDRVRQFDSVAGAEAYAGFVCRLASARNQPVTVGLSATKVVVTLHGHPVRGCSGGLTDAVFNLAAEIG
jgi:pterin-4a-carbinolamine dehydratase